MGSFTFYFESGVKLDLKVKRGGTYCAFSDIPRPVLEDIQVALTRAMEGKGDK